MNWTLDTGYWFYSKIARLTPPLVIGGVTYKSLWMLENDVFRVGKLTKSDLTTFYAGGDEVSLGIMAGPFPWGYSVEPDQPESEL